MPGAAQPRPAATAPAGSDCSGRKGAIASSKRFDNINNGSWRWQWHQLWPACQPACQPDLTAAVPYTWHLLSDLVTGPSAWGWYKLAPHELWVVQNVAVQPPKRQGNSTPYGTVGALPRERVASSVPEPHGWLLSQKHALWKCWCVHGEVCGPT